MLNQSKPSYYGGVGFIVVTWRVGADCRLFHWLRNLKSQFKDEITKTWNVKLKNISLFDADLNLYFDFRLQLERRERENIHLQLEEARAKLRTSEEDKEECEEKLRDLEKQKLEKEKEISELKRQIEEEKQSYLENLK